MLSAQQAVEHLFDHDGVELDQLGKSLDDLVLEQQGGKTCEELLESDVL